MLEINFICKFRSLLWGCYLNGYSHWVESVEGLLAGSTTDWVRSPAVGAQPGMARRTIYKALSSYYNHTTSHKHSGDWWFVSFSLLFTYTLPVSIFSSRRVILELYLQPQEQCVANQHEWLNELAEHLRDSGISGREAKTTVESLHKAGIVEEQVDFLHCLMHYRSYFMRPMLLEIKTVESIGPDIHILHTNGHSNFIYPLFILSFKITCLSTFANFCMFRLKREDLNLHWVVVGRGTRNSGFGNSTHKQISIWSGYTFCLFVKYIFRYHCFIPFEAFSIPSRPSPHPHDIIRSLCPSVSHSCSEERSRSSKSSFGSVKYRREPEGLKITTIRNDLELKY